MQNNYNITETPERWVILKLPNEVYKVFGVWTGGYLTSDRWKLNSGVEKVEQDDDFYYFIGFSGSCYKCQKSKYGISSSYYGKGILSHILLQSEGKIKLMKDKEDWTKIWNIKK